MQKGIYVKEIQPNYPVQGFFIVRKSQSRKTRAGSFFWSLTLADTSGEIEAKIWRPEQCGLAVLPGEGTILEVMAGQGSSYNDTVQLTLETCRSLDEIESERLDPEWFRARSPRSADGMRQELEELIERELTWKPWNEFVKAVFGDFEILAAFCSCPGAIRVHHAYVGGLLEHTLGVCALCRAFSDAYPELDRQLLLVGALFHDIGKIREYACSLDISSTDEGRLLGHLTMGVDILEPFLRQSDIPSHLAMHLRHLILSHHGEAEFGACVAPQTPEAIALHFADNMDAKMAICRTQRTMCLEKGTTWTDSIFALDHRRLFFGEKTPSDGTEMTPFSSARTPAHAIEHEGRRPGEGEKKPTTGLLRGRSEEHEKKTGLSPGEGASEKRLLGPEEKPAFLVAGTPFLGSEKHDSTHRTGRQSEDYGSEADPGTLTAGGRGEKTYGESSAERGPDEDISADPSVSARPLAKNVQGKGVSETGQTDVPGGDVPSNTPFSDGEKTQASLPPLHKRVLTVSPNAPGSFLPEEPEAEATGEFEPVAHSELSFGVSEEKKTGSGRVEAPRGEGPERAVSAPAPLPEEKISGPSDFLDEGDEAARGEAVIEDFSFCDAESLDNLHFVEELPDFKDTDPWNEDVTEEMLGDGLAGVGEQHSLPAREPEKTAGEKWERGTPVPDGEKAEGHGEQMETARDEPDVKAPAAFESTGHEVSSPSSDSVPDREIRGAVKQSQEEGGLWPDSVSSVSAAGESPPSSAPEGAVPTMTAPSVERGASDNGKRTPPPLEPAFSWSNLTARAPGFGEEREAILHKEEKRKRTRQKKDQVQTDLSLFSE
ncbi:MAG: HD domain-containing protein [Desulfovibrio sp.]|nr:HD domain-containing protein [Desulfovibrio sp.]